jgi:hypothetical protein
MYQLTEDPNVVIYLDTGATIPNGNWQWDEYEKWLEAGNTPEPVLPPSVEVTAREYESGVQAWMDTTVQGNGYADLLTCISFISSGDETAAADARAASDWRDAVWPAFWAMVQDWIDTGNPVDLWPPLQYVTQNMPQAADYGWIPRAPSSGFASLKFGKVQPKKV